MTELLLVVGFVGGVALRSAVPAVIRWRESRRLPVQFFQGRMFPHPLDDGWEVSPGAARFPNGLRAPVITLTRQRTYECNSWTYLRIDDVVIESGSRPESFLRAIEKAHNERILSKALEALP